MLNSRSIRNKADAIADYITDRPTDLMTLTEIWLSAGDAGPERYI